MTEQTTAEHDASQQPEEWQPDYDKYARRMSKSVDATVRILRAHLIIEEVINDALDYLLCCPDHLRGGRLSFYQKLQVLRACLPSRTIAPLAEVEKLNQVRNRLAHHIEHPQADSGVKEFVSLIYQRRGMPVPTDDDEALGAAVAYLCGSMGGWLYGLREVKARLILFNSGQETSDGGG